MRLRFTADARADLRNIVIDGAQRWGEVRARSYVVEFRAKLLVLTKHPHLGPAADDVSEGLRRYGYMSHNAFYRTVRGDVVVVRILHKQMQPQRHLS